MQIEEQFAASNNRSEALSVDDHYEVSITTSEGMQEQLLQQQSSQVDTP
jgi:hypothetical protein